MVDYTTASGYVTDDKGRRQYVDRSDAAGVQGTYLLASDRNQDRNAIMDPIITAGLSGNAADDTLLTQAIRFLCGEQVSVVNDKIVNEATLRANADALLQPLLGFIPAQQGGGFDQVAGKVYLGRDTTYPGLRYSYVNTSGDITTGGYLLSTYGTELNGAYGALGDLSYDGNHRLVYQSYSMNGTYYTAALYSDITAEATARAAAVTSEATARANADAQLVSGTSGMVSGDAQGTGLHYSGTGRMYASYTGGGGMLAWYADVTAETSRAEAAESAEATARANADANLISGTVGMATGDEQGLTLHYSSTGYPYFGYSGGGDFLAWHSNVTAETSRAEAAEAAEATARANADAKLVSGFWNPTDTQVAALVFSGGNTSTVSAVSPSGAYYNLAQRADVPVGCLTFWPSSTPPSGWLILNGASFSTTTYPVLAARFPSGVLPDMRGKFVRAWDDGAGIDPTTGRALLSVQQDAVQEMTGSAYTTVADISTANAATGVFNTGTHTAGNVPSSSSVSGAYHELNFDASAVARTATETRPVNMAWNAIVRAA